MGSCVAKSRKCDGNAGGTGRTADLSGGCVSGKILHVHGKTGGTGWDFKEPRSARRDGKVCSAGWNRDSVWDTLVLRRAWLSGSAVENVSGWDGAIRFPCGCAGKAAGISEKAWEKRRAAKRFHKSFFWRNDTEYICLFKREQYRFRTDFWQWRVWNETERGGSLCGRCPCVHRLSVWCAGRSEKERIPQWQCGGAAKRLYRTESERGSFKIRACRKSVPLRGLRFQNFYENNGNVASELYCWTAHRAG